MLVGCLTDDTTLLHPIVVYQSAEVKRRVVFSGEYYQIVVFLGGVDNLFTFGSEVGVFVASAEKQGYEYDGCNSFHCKIIKVYKLLACRATAATAG